MSEPVDKNLYEKVKKEVYRIYDRPSAYRSGFLVKRYKEEFKRKFGDQVEPYYDNKGKKNERPLARWFDERWMDVNPLKTETSYPVYRPTRIIDPLKTPLTVQEVDKLDLLRKSILKQKFKDKKNLPPFERFIPPSRR